MGRGEGSATEAPPPGRAGVTQGAAGGGENVPGPPSIRVGSDWAARAKGSAAGDAAQSPRVRPPAPDGAQSD